MRLRVTAAMRKQLADLRGPQGKARAGVMIVPQMLSIEAWEAQAIPAQRALMEDSMLDHRGRAIHEPAPPPMTAQQEREFAQQIRGSRFLGLNEEQRAARAYAKAIGLLR